LLSDRVNKLESAVLPPPAAIVGATLAAGRLHQILDANGICRDAPPGLAVEDLPDGCLIHDVVPGTVAMLYRSTLDGSASVQVVGGIDIEIVTGRKPDGESPAGDNQV
jgi:hypothetical protein